MANLSHFTPKPQSDIERSKTAADLFIARYQVSLFVVIKSIVFRITLT